MNFFYFLIFLLNCLSQIIYSDNNIIEINQCVYTDNNGFYITDSKGENNVISLYTNGSLSSSGQSVLQNVVINENLNIFENASVNGILNVTGQSNLSTVNTNSLNAAQDVKITGDLVVIGDTIIGHKGLPSSVTITGPITMTGDTNLIGNITSSGNAIFNTADIANLNVTNLVNLSAAIISGNIKTESLNVTENSILASTIVTGNATIESLNVSGNSVLSGLTATTSNLGSTSVNGNLSISGTLNVTGNTTLTIATIPNINSTSNLNITSSTGNINLFSNSISTVKGKSLALLISSNNSIITSGASSKELKENILPINLSDDLFKLIPSSFDYNLKSNLKGVHDWGIIAEDLIGTDLEACIIYDNYGKIYGLDYHMLFIAVLSKLIDLRNEFLEFKKECKFFKNKETHCFREK